MRNHKVFALLVAGIVAGFGGQTGCSLGFHMVIAPALALLRDNQAIVIHPTFSRQGIALTNVMVEPDQIAFHSIDLAT